LLPPSCLAEIAMNVITKGELKESKALIFFDLAGR
jgi:hypothetical protein